MRTIYDLQFTIYNLRFTIYNLQFTNYDLQFTDYGIRFMIWKKHLRVLFFIDFFTILILFINFAI